MDKLFFILMAVAASTRCKTLPVTANCPLGPNVNGVCATDCKIGHNAVSGNCNLDGFCDCTEFGGAGIKSIQQCVSNKNDQAAYYYRLECEIDCACNHGRVGAGVQCRFPDDDDDSYKGSGSGCDCNKGTYDVNASCPCGQLGNLKIVQNFLLATASAYIDDTALPDPPCVCGFN